MRISSQGTTIFHIQTMPKFDAVVHVQHHCKHSCLAMHQCLLLWSIVCSCCWDIETRHFLTDESMLASEISNVVSFQEKEPDNKDWVRPLATQPLHSRQPEEKLLPGLHQYGRWSRQGSLSLRKQQIFFWGRPSRGVNPCFTSFPQHIFSVYLLRAVTACRSPQLCDLVGQHSDEGCCSRRCRHQSEFWSVRNHAVDTPGIIQEGRAEAPKWRCRPKWFKWVTALLLET